MWADHASQPAHSPARQQVASVATPVRACVRVSASQSDARAAALMTQLGGQAVQGGGGVLRGRSRAQNGTFMLLVRQEQNAQDERLATSP